MTPVASILSTKVLSEDLREQLISNHIAVQDKNFISIAYNQVDLKSDALDHVVLITSKNIIKSLLDSNQIHILTGKKIYCVGNSIPKLLETHDISVQQSFQNAKALGAFIVQQNFKSVTFLRGNKSRPELPRVLQDHGIRLRQYELYTTMLTPKKVDLTFDALLFFCPSAVESYLTHHRINNEQIICIGQTTASAVQPYSNNIMIADHQKVSSVIQKTIELFQTS